MSASALVSNFAAHLILTDMITRVTKEILGAKLRSLSETSNSAYVSTVITFFNLLLGSSPASTHFWRNHLKIALILKFGWYGPIFTTDENALDADLRPFVLRTELWRSLQVCAVDEH